MATSQKAEITAVAKREEPREEKGLRAFLTHEPIQARIAPFLPEGVKYERVVAAAQLAAKANTAILECTHDSIIMAVAKALQAGLEIGDTAHLVPFGKTLTFVADYKGLAQLMIESGAVRFVEAFAVYQNDLFEYEQGSNAHLRHIPTGDPKARGALIGAYVILTLPFGMQKFLWMPLGDKDTPDTIEHIRQKHSKSWKGGACPAWYAKKTVVRQSAKLVPRTRRSAEMLAKLRELDAMEAEATGTLPRLAHADDDDIPQAPRLASGPVSDPADVDRRDNRAKVQGAMEDLGAGQSERAVIRETPMGEEWQEEFQDDRDLVEG